MNCSIDKNQPIENGTEMTQMLELADKNFKAAIITLLMDEKENVLTMNKRKFQPMNRSYIFSKRRKFQN